MEGPVPNRIYGHLTWSDYYLIIHCQIAWYLILGHVHTQEFHDDGLWTTYSHAYMNIQSASLFLPPFIISIPQVCIKNLLKKFNLNWLVY